MFKQHGWGVRCRSLGRGRCKANYELNFNGSWNIVKCFKGIVLKPTKILVSSFLAAVHRIIQPQIVASSPNLATWILSMNGRSSSSSSKLSPHSSVYSSREAGNILLCFWTSGISWMDMRPWNDEMLKPVDNISMWWQSLDPWQTRWRGHQP